MCCLHLSNQGSRFNFFRTQRHGDTDLFIKNIRETTDSGKGMALCLCVSVFQRKGCYQVFGLFPHLSVESVPELYWPPLF